MKATLTLMLVALLAGCTGTNDSNITASGTIETTTVTVAAKVGGQIAALRIDDGSVVRQGDTLLVLDPTDLQLAFKQAAANEAAAEAQYAMTRNGFRTEEIVQADATAENAREDLGRMERLFGAHAVTQKQLDDARLRATVAVQNADKLRRGFRPEEIAAAAARRDLAAAQREAAQKKLNDTYVIAPVDGVVTEKGVETGDIVLPNGSLLKISRQDRMHLRIYVSELELAKVSLSQRAEVTIDAMPERPFEGKVASIADVAEFTPKNVQTRDDRTTLVFGIKITIPNPDYILKAGMPADALLRANQTPER